MRSALLVAPIIMQEIINNAIKDGTEIPSVQLEKIILTIDRRKAPVHLILPKSFRYGNLNQLCPSYAKCLMSRSGN